LKRFLRYDETRKEKIITSLLGKWQVVQKDLIPILEQHSTVQPVFFAASMYILLQEQARDKILLHFIKENHKCYFRPFLRA
jgi:hypothetical protein